LKKIITLIAIITTLTNFSQDLKLTPEGFKSNEGKSYIIINIDSISKEKLYTKTLVSLNKFYKSSKDVLNTVEHESISINAIHSKRIRRTSLHSFKLNYTISLLFRDNKIKLEITSLNMTAFNQKRQRLLLYKKNKDFFGYDFGIYKKGNKVRSQKSIDDLNDFSNNFISYLKDSLNKKHKDDW
jgi:hypothetical protein